MSRTAKSDIGTISRSYDIEPRGSYLGLRQIGLKTGKRSIKNVSRFSPAYPLPNEQLGNDDCQKSNANNAVNLEEGPIDAGQIIGPDQPMFVSDQGRDRA